MGEIADMGAGALDDLAVVLDQLVKLFGQGFDLGRELPGEAIGLARADGGQSRGNAPQWP